MRLPLQAPFPRILFTGGAGYIGSHTAVTLLEAGCAVVVVDSLVNSNVQSVHTIERLTGQRVSFYQTDLRERTRLTQILRDEKIDHGQLSMLQTVS